MSGNVWGWCNDWWYGDYPKGTCTDPVSEASGTFYLMRGGSWRDGASGCAVAGWSISLLDRRYNDFEFRLLRPQF